MIAADGKAMKPRLQTPRSWASLQNQGGPHPGYSNRAITGGVKRAAELIGSFGF
jgi:hypothetical protein